MRWVRWAAATTAVFLLFWVDALHLIPVGSRRARLS